MTGRLRLPYTARATNIEGRCIQKINAADPANASRPPYLSLRRGPDLVKGKENLDDPLATVALLDSA
jgi:hypothetical protein